MGPATAGLATLANQLKSRAARAATALRTWLVRTAPVASGVREVPPPDANRPMNCASCSWSEPVVGEIRAWLECRVRPPQVLPIPDRPGAMTSSFPVVRSDEWCAEYELMEGEH